jgi:hypothetical protein
MAFPVLTPSTSPRAGHPENTITLSERFYDETNEHPISVEKHVRTSLATLPCPLDFYVWLVWKIWTVKSGPPRFPPSVPKDCKAYPAGLSVPRSVP